MARTWPARKWKSALLATIDVVGRPVAALIRAARSGERSANVRRIIVIELWQIGDVVLATPFLRALRQCFPQASITLLAKPHASQLLEHSGLVDDVVEVELPWTNPSGKYAPSAYDAPKLSALVRSLRRRRFDLSFDARMDLRSNVLAALIGASRRIGFRYGGGHWLLTDAVRIDPRANHKVDDWLALLAPAGCAPLVDRKCVLKTSQAERAEAEVAISRSGGGRVVGIHPGGSHAGKRWPLNRFSELAAALIADGMPVIAFVGDDGYGQELADVEGVVVSRTGLRRMMGLVEQCCVFVCNDSGPMHIAAALGVPTVAIFESGEPRWYGPIGDEHIVVAGKRAGVDVSAAPRRDGPADPVPASIVFDAVKKQLSRHEIKNRR